MKFLHLINDEKFTDGVINTFDVLGVESDYVWLQSSPRDFVYMSLRDRLRIVVVGSEEYEALLKTNVYDCVWVHYADLEKIEFVRNYRGRGKIFWSTWGADYVCMINSNLYEPRTLWHVLRKRSARSLLGFFVRHCAAMLHLEKLLLPSRLKEFRKRVDYFSCVVAEEEPLVRRLVGNRPRYLQFHYVDLKRKTHGRRQVCLPEDPVVWAGNSATFENNTFDAIDALARLEPCEVYAPLSYGYNTPETSAEISAYGKKRLHDRWHPILNFMPYDEYARLLQKCNVFIFYHRRQQGAGNVSIALLSGGCVILNERSPIATHYDRLGVKTYRMKDLKDGLAPLLARHRPIAQRNADLVTAYWEKSLDRMQETVNVLKQDLTGAQT